MSWRAVKSFAASAVGGCRNSLKSVLRTRHYQPGDTHRCIWQKSPDAKLSYVMYRTVHALFMLILLMISFFHVGVDCPYTKENAERYTCFGKYAQINPAWPFYLTRWGLILNFVQALMGLIFVMKAYRRRSRNQPEIHVEQPSEPTDPNLPEPVQNTPEMPGTKKSKNLTASGKKSAKTPGPVQNSSEAVQNPPDIPIAPESTPGNKKSKNLTASGKTSAKTPGPVVNSSESVPSTEGNRAGQESSRSRPSPRRPEHSLLTFTGFYWSIHSVATTLTIIIDVVYWTLLHDYSKKVTVSLFYYVSEHAVNFVLMSVDSFVVAFPMLLLHIRVLILAGVLYSLVNFFYYIAGGLDQKFRKRYMYPFLNWEYPIQTIVNMSGVFTFTVFIMLLLILLDIKKHRCFRPGSATPRQMVSTSRSRIDAV